MDAVNLCGVWPNFPTGTTPPFPPTPTPEASSGAGSYPSGASRLTERLTRVQWLHLLYGPEGPTVEQLSELQLQWFLEDDDMTALMLL